MTARPLGAPRPASLRAAAAHPARATRCPHCQAHPGQPCTTRTGKRLPDLHPARISAHAMAVACCPHCQVEPGVPCHDAGRARRTVHARRYQEAEDTRR
ncbi:zinc finger domain-containing protein [Streptomyces sp. NPDC055733]